MALGQDDPGLDVEGNEEYRIRRRYQAIYDAKEVARDVILEAKRLYSRGEIDPMTLQTDARAAVEAYITEIEQIAMNAQAREILEEKHIHTVELPPPQELLDYYDSPEHEPVTDRPGPKEAAQIEGLWDFLTAPDVFTATWKIKVDVRHEGPQTITATNQSRMPVEASIDTFRVVNGFLQDVNLDLDLQWEPYEGEGGPGI